MAKLSSGHLVCARKGARPGTKRAKASARAHCGTMERGEAAMGPHVEVLSGFGEVRSDRFI
jgi:hypothetical protein